MSITASLSVAWDLGFESALESFFANEGGLLLEANRLYRAARRSLAAHAYWRALWNLERGDARRSFDLWGITLGATVGSRVQPDRRVRLVIV
jgi:hypothetical protein